MQFYLNRMDSATRAITLLFVLSAVFDGAMRRSGRTRATSPHAGHKRYWWI